MIRVVRITRALRLFKTNVFRDLLEIVNMTMILSADMTKLLLLAFAINLLVFSSFVYVFEKGTFHEADGL